MSHNKNTNLTKKKKEIKITTSILQKDAFTRSLFPPKISLHFAQIQTLSYK